MQRNVQNLGLTTNLPVLDRARGSEVLAEMQRINDKPEGVRTWSDLSFDVRLEESRRRLTVVKNVIEEGYGSCVPHMLDFFPKVYEKDRDGNLEDYFGKYTRVVEMFSRVLNNSRLLPFPVPSDLNFLDKPESIDVVRRVPLPLGIVSQAAGYTALEAQLLYEPEHDPLWPKRYRFSIVY